MLVNTCQSSVLFQHVAEKVLRLRKFTLMPNTLGLGLLPLLCFEGLHTFSHVCFCSAALWFRFSESLANLGGLLVICCNLTRPCQNDLCLNPTKPETALAHRTHSGTEREGPRTKELLLVLIKFLGHVHPSSGQPEHLSLKPPWIT